MGEGISRVAPLGTPLERHPFFIPKSVAKGLQKLPQGGQKDTQSAPKAAQRLKFAPIAM